MASDVAVVLWGRCCCLLLNEKGQSFKVVKWLTLWHSDLAGKNQALKAHLSDWRGYILPQLHMLVLKLLRRLFISHIFMIQVCYGLVRQWWELSNTRWCCQFELSYYKSRFEGCVCVRERGRESFTIGTWRMRLYLMKETIGLKAQNMQ